MRITTSGLAMLMAFFLAGAFLGCASDGTVPASDDVATQQPDQAPETKKKKAKPKLTLEGGWKGKNSPVLKSPSDEPPGGPFRRGASDDE